MIFSDEETQLIRSIFSSYIAAKVRDPKASILSREIKEKYLRQMSGLPEKSPFAVLEKYKIERIVTIL